MSADLQQSYVTRGSTIVGELAYLTLLLGFSGNAGEKQLARDTLSRLKHAAIFVCRRSFTGPDRRQ